MMLCALSSTVITTLSQRRYAPSSTPVYKTLARFVVVKLQSRRSANFFHTCVLTSLSLKLWAQYIWLLNRLEPRKSGSPVFRHQLMCLIYTQLFPLELNVRYFVNAHRKILNCLSCRLQVAVWSVYNTSCLTMVRLYILRKNYMIYFIARCFRQILKPLQDLKL